MRINHGKLRLLTTSQYEIMEAIEQFGAVLNTVHRSRGWHNSVNSLYEKGYIENALEGSKILLTNRGMMALTEERNRNNLIDSIYNLEDYRDSVSTRDNELTELLDVSLVKLQKVLRYLLNEKENEHE